MREKGRRFPGLASVSCQVARLPLGMGRVSWHPGEQAGANKPGRPLLQALFMTSMTRGALRAEGAAKGGARWRGAFCAGYVYPRDERRGRAGARLATRRRFDEPAHAASRRHGATVRGCRRETAVVPLAGALAGQPPRVWQGHEPMLGGGGGGGGGGALITKKNERRGADFAYGPRPSRADAPGGKGLKQGGRRAARGG